MSRQRVWRRKGPDELRPEERLHLSPEDPAPFAVLLLTRGQTLHKIGEPVHLRMETLDLRFHAIGHLLLVWRNDARQLPAQATRHEWPTPTGRAAPPANPSFTTFRSRASSATKEPARTLLNTRLASSR